MKNKICILLLFLSSLGIAQESELPILKSEEEKYKIESDIRNTYIELPPVSEENPDSIWTELEDITEKEITIMYLGSILNEDFSAPDFEIKKAFFDKVFNNTWKGYKVVEYGLPVKTIESSTGKITLYEDDKEIFEEEISNNKQGIFHYEYNYKYGELYGNYIYSLHNTYRIGSRYSFEVETDKEERGNYFYGMKVGEWLEKNMDRNWEEVKVEYLNGRRHGKYINEYGEFQYVNGFKHGKWIEKRDGEVKEYIYNYGKIISEK